MHNLRRWYYDNRDKIWIIILISGFVLLCINTFDDFYKNRPVEEKNTNVISIKDTINNEITGQLDGTASLVTGTGKDRDVLHRDIQLIDEFIKNCSNGNVQEAYDLLTDECKEEVFPTIETFKKNYYNNVFSTPKIYSVQNWIKNTYRVMIKDDALVTGKVSEDDSHLQEHMTVKSTENGYKLNINDYIGRTEKNKIVTGDEVEVTVVKKETYMNYEEYTIQVKNTTNHEIILDNGEKTNTIYLQDENKIKEYVNTASIQYGNLKILPGITRTYTLRFQNPYSTTRKMQYLVFEKAILKDNEGNIEYKKIMINV